MLAVLNTIIEYSFYLLFALVPLVFTSVNSELFEYNKMMLTYGLTAVIAGAWAIKCLVNKKFIFRHTFLEIPLLAYLASHVLSTIFSIDPHVSIWGYYSRFHEGLLATISYLTLYFAAVSNLSRRTVLRSLIVSFACATIVSLWGALEHFGHSPSCLAITGKFDDNCWIQDVKNRVFASLGQPNWMAAYLDITILASLGFIIKIKDQKSRLNSLLFPALSGLFFAGLLFTKSRSGILGLIAGLAVFVLSFLFQNRKNLLPAIRPLFIPAALLLIVAAAFGLPFSQIEKFSLENLLSKKSPPAANIAPAPAPNPGYIDIGISESGDIRRVVWEGAVKIWRRYPIFGSGVETFAYAYYLDRPAAHNLLSEWDFLYNKAHNEYLNLLATTGTVGFAAYLGIILTFTVWSIYNLQFAIFNKFKMFQNSKIENSFQTSNFSSEGARSQFQIIALYAAYVSILVTNFFGFSVVIIGLFFFLIPAFCHLLAAPDDPTKPSPKSGSVSFFPQPKTAGKEPTLSLSTSQWILIAITGIAVFAIEANLIKMWQADQSYAMGKNYDSVQDYVHASPFLEESVQSEGSEPTYRDELSLNESQLAAALFGKLNTASIPAIASLSAAEKLQIKIPIEGSELSASDLVNKAVSNSNVAIETSPNSLPFWKTRTKVFYTLSTVDGKYILDSLSAIQQAANLAPTDAKVRYNLGLLLSRTGRITTAIKVLKETLALKPDYRDAHYALGLLYKDTGDVDSARAEMEFILQKIGPDAEAQKLLEQIKVQ